MSENNNINENLDKLTLKELRKERKCIKKALKREQRERENNKKRLEMKLGPTDQRINIISKNEMNIINKSKEVICNNEDFNLNIDDNFPILNNNIKIKPKQEKMSSLSNLNNQEQTLTKKRNKLTVNLSDILSKPKPVVTVLKRQLPKERTGAYTGNILDASQPERYKGKHREVPKSKPLTKLKSQIVSDMKKIESHENITLNISDNLITDELNTLVTDFLNNIVRFQYNLYKKDSIKGVAKRRYVVGLREVKKYLIVKKIKILIIAPNFKNVIENGALDLVVQELISLAKENEIPYVFALSRRKLGQITLKALPVSCIGIFYYDGAEETFNKIMKLLNDLREPFETSFRKSHT